jgi:hypothetical protein
MIACLLSEFRIPSELTRQAQESRPQKGHFAQILGRHNLSQPMTAALHHNLTSECERFRPLLRIKWIQLNQQPN